ncbi:MAG: VWA domain-containing protein [Phycisphaerales bacterium]|nr:VWA domain-containing protein [Phycisphaerales bacterium]MCB9856042.1 VWA domain-containing protein [Phycisphaerales bacterium]MCB9863930.1 VWA domain-containing protein [Phycisphaerales bacterium]
MSFLTWPAALMAASISIPLLLLLYFLKLRRVERTISSTLLWKKAIQDLQVNAPFQKLRKNLLLLLQFLLLLAVLMAIAGPVVNFVRQPERNVVLLIDQSASMRTKEADGRLRIDLAREAARDFVDNLPSGSKAMVVAFSDRAEVVCTFTNDKRRLKDRIDSIEATDAKSRIGEALQLAVAYSSSFVETTGDAGFNPESLQIADIELFGDGRLTDAADEFVTRARMTHHIIGQASDNVGITAYDVRREIDRPGVVSVFAEIQNFGDKPVTLDASLFLDDKLKDVQQVTLGPASIATSRPASDDLLSGRNVLFEPFDHDAGGVLTVKLSRDDSFPLDNVASGPIDPPRALRVLVVADDREIAYMMERVFRDALEINDVTLMGAGNYEDAEESELAVEGRSAFDLVVLSDHDTARLFPGNYIFFGGVPKIDSLTVDGDVEENFFVTWREGHPLLRYVTLDNVYTRKWKRLNLPPHAARLVDGEDSTVMALITDPGHRYLVVAFGLLDTNFRMQPAFPIFMQNAVDYLAGGAVTDSSRLIAPGDTFTVPTPPGAQMMTVVRPDGTEEEVAVEDRHTMTYGRTREIGSYLVKFDDKDKTTETFCANILDATESTIRPNKALTLSGQAIETVSGDVEVNEPLWPWAVGLALVLLLVEWWIYNRRVMI